MEWVESEIRFLKRHYAKRGKRWCAEKLLRTEASIRHQASRLKLKHDDQSDFCKEWQKRAAQSKVGKKRPEQAKVIMASWAAGKLNKTLSQRKAIGARVKAMIALKGHPRGMQGKKHSPESKAKFSILSKERWQKLSPEEKMLKTKRMILTKHAKGIYAGTHRKTTWKAAWREFGGKKHFYRSRWEANYGRYLEFLKLQGKIKEWLHEPDVFWFEGAQKGCVSYLPDFKVIRNDDSIEYHEVKGWMDERSLTKIKRMAKYHPKIKLLVIKQKEYNEILLNLSKLIPGWE